MSKRSRDQAATIVKDMCVSYYRATGLPLVISPKLAKIAREKGVPPEAFIENKPIPVSGGSRDQTL